MRTDNQLELKGKKRYLAFIYVMAAFSIFCIRPCWAEIIINSGGALNINSESINLNCSPLTILDGGTLNIATGAVNSCGHFKIASGGTFLDAAGYLSICGTWTNDSDFVKNPNSVFEFIDVVGYTHQTYGVGDTDDDGVSDYNEGFKDTNNDGVWDFLDLNIISRRAASFIFPMLLLLDE